MIFAKKKILVWCDDPPEDRVISIVAGCLANHDRAHSQSGGMTWGKVVVWLFIGTQKKVSVPPLCPSRLTKRRTYRPSSVIYRYVSRQSSEK